MSEIQALYPRQDPKASVEQRARCGGYLTSAQSWVRVRDPDTGKLLPHGSEGELEVTGPSRMIGYLDDTTATESVFTSDGFIRRGIWAIPKAMVVLCFWAGWVTLSDWVVFWSTRLKSSGN
ncbi:MAG: hypothetical protein Ct9H300mP13_1440 [Gammaproteobacteria bacterium]|nr:MAG: hypothetical protein Ct9H300mP13_1440 [Gammaproteobacteria bacterium]